MTHILSDVSAYAEGKLDTELASKGLVTEATNPYPQGTIDHAEYDRGVRDAQPRTRIIVQADGEISLVEV
jgi:hypothetical protein